MLGRLLLGMGVHVLAELVRRPRRALAQSRQPFRVFSWNAVALEDLRNHRRRKPRQVDELDIGMSG